MARVPFALPPRSLPRQAFRMFVNVIQRSLPAMKVLMIFMLLLMTLFGSLIYSVRAICAVCFTTRLPSGWWQASCRVFVHALGQPVSEKRPQKNETCCAIFPAPHTRPSAASGR